ncbi:MAG: hypothetical protein K8R69_11645, partial [Deltaproteobacteria bacterium]|nr:hypothetical protein [Deltaproteobacteria bacterium]
ASMLPREGSYVYLSPASSEGTPANPGVVTAQEFNARLLDVETGLMGHALSTFVQPEHFTTEDLIHRRFQHQFGYYEWYRFFDRNKGPTKQRARYERAGLIEEMFIPGLRRYLAQNPTLLEVNDPAQGIIRPEQITPANFRNLRFSWIQGPAAREAAYQRHLAYRSEMNRANLSQTMINIASNGTSRQGSGRINWVSYGARKIERFLGMGSGNFPREYSAQSSHFETADQRLGRVDNPVSQMVILAGYGPRDENDPEVFRGIANYAEDEIAQGKQPNLLFHGNNPSKFTLPIRGIPAIAYRFMDALRSPAMKNIVVVGTPDVGVVLEAFQQHFASEIAEQGKRFIYVNTGLEGGGFAVNLQQGIDALPEHNKMAVLSYGDTPRVDINNMAFHPWRHTMDYIFGANGRDQVLDFMGMNAHYQGEIDGVDYPLKEGNVQGIRRMPTGLFSEMFANRKTVRSGPAGKALIFLRHLLSRPYHPNILDLPNVIGDTIMRSAENMAMRTAGGKPPLVAVSIDAAERAMASRLQWKGDFRPGHLDMGGLVDLDGVRDYAIAQALAYEYPHAHADDLETFRQETLPQFQDRLPLLTGAAAKINNLYVRVREELLQREAERPTDQKLGITDDSLRRLGFDPEALPMLPTGELNPAWMERVLPDAEIQAYRRSFTAYDNRVDHARQLDRAFQDWQMRTRPYEEPERREVGKTAREFVLRRLNSEPERYRGLILEWSFDRLRDQVMKEARGRFGEFSPQVAQVNTYFEQSTTHGYDTPLRRILLGFKAADGLRRYQNFLSAGEFQTLYPKLVESLHLARETISGNRWLGLGRGGLRDGRFFLRGYLDQAQVTADEIYVRKVGESPPAYRSRGAGASLPNSEGRPAVSLEGREVRRADSPVYLQKDLDFMARRLEILPSRMPHLVAAASGVRAETDLGRVSSQRMSYDRLLAWSQSGAGQTYLRENESFLADSLRNRIYESGPGMAVGLVSMLGFEHLADRVGLDQRAHPHERFAFVVGGSHLVNAGTTSLTEVVTNRYFAQPFRFASTRAVSAGSEAAVQFSFASRESFSRALGASLSRNLGLEGSLGRMAWNGTRGLVTMPFRAAWGMGPGLMASAIVDRTIGRALPEGSAARNALHLGSFFLPDVYRIALGNRGPAFFEGPTMRFATRAFAAGFIADMTFMGAQRVMYGSEGVTTRNLIYQRANQLHDREEGTLHRVVDGAFEMIAPQISAWWDSVELDGLGFRPNSYQNQATQELRSFSSNTTERADALLRHAMLFGSGGSNLDPSFYTRVDWGFVRGENRLENIRLENGREFPVRDVLEQLQDPNVARRFSGEAGAREDQAAYIQRQFRGYRLSHAEAEQILERIAVHTLRNDLGSINQYALPENSAMRSLFDERGSLRPGQEQALLRRLYPDTGVDEAVVLRQRRVALATTLLQARNSSNPASAEPYLAVARNIGLVGADGAILDPEIRRAAESQIAALPRAASPLGLSTVSGGGISPRNSLALRLGGVSLATAATRLTPQG